MTTATAPVTDAEIDAAILAALPDSGDLVSWADVRQRVPGDVQAQGMALTRLFERHRLAVVKIRGRNYVRRASSWDLRVAAAERERAAQTRPYPHVSRCRQFVAV